MLVTAACNTTNKNTNWNKSMRMQDKIPYGTYLAYNMLQQLNPKASVKNQVEIFTKKEKEQLYTDSITNSCKVIIALTLEFNDTEQQNILDFVKAGNTIFINTSYANIAFLNEPELHYTENGDARTFDDTIKNIDSVHQIFTIKGNGADTFTPYHFIGAMFEKKHLQLNTKSKFTETVLGTDEMGDANFVRINYGKGVLFINTAPATFTNHFLLQHNNRAYLSTAFSYLPSNINTITWHQFKNRHADYSQEDENKSKNDFFKSELLDKYPMWKAAVLLAFLGIILYVLSNMRRRQKEVPVVPPVINNSVAFVETIGQLYYNNQNHLNIADKMMRHFLEDAKVNYNITINKLDDNFINILSSKSNKSYAETETLIKTMVAINTAQACDAVQLEDLYVQIKKFKTKK
jgi:hypothetical protein